MSKRQVYEMLADIELDIENKLFLDKNDIYEKEFGRRDVADAISHCQIRRKVLRELAEGAE